MKCVFVFFFASLACHILVEGVAPLYTLQNTIGERQNCTLTAMYPAVVAVHAISIGQQQEMNFDVSIRM